MRTRRKPLFVERKCCQLQRNYHAPSDVSTERQDQRRRRLMRRPNHRWRAGLCLLLAAAIVAGEVHAYENIGVASFVRNEVTGVLPTRSVVINVGENVVRDEIVKTSQDSVAKLVFTDSSNLSIGPNSMVKLDKFVAAGASSYGKETINVLKGAFRFTTGHFDKRAYEVKTGVATIGVRGTIYEGRAEPNRTILNVLEGAVRVRTTGGGGCDLSAGQSAVITASNCSPAAGFAPNSQIFAEQCAKSPALCSKEEYSQLQPPQQNEQGFFGGKDPATLIMPAAGIGGGIGAWLAARSKPGNPFSYYGRFVCNPPPGPFLGVTPQAIRNQADDHAHCPASP